MRINLNSSACALLMAGTLSLPGQVPAQPDAPPTAESAEDAEVSGSPFHLTLGVDVTSAYFGRGIFQEDRAAILQPFLEADLSLLRKDDFSLALTAGLWSSLHRMQVGGSVDEMFLTRLYEHDWTAGFRVSLDRWTADLTWLSATTTPGGGSTTNEVDLALAWDDTGDTGTWSLQPQVLLGWELGPAAGDGGRNGVYCELGVAPSLTFPDGLLEDCTLSFPVSVGLSLSNYYESPSGRNDMFGWASAGVMLDVPLLADPSFCCMNMSLGAHALWLGPAAREFNSGEGLECILCAGVTISF